MGTHLVNALLFAQDSSAVVPDLPDNYVAMAFFVVTAVVAVVAILATAWVSAKKSFYITSLKEKMIERGMSAAEIERVLAAGTKKGCGPRASMDESELPPAKSQPTPMRWPAHSNS